MRWTLAILNAVSLLMIVLFTTIETPTFTLSFYDREYDKYHIPEQIQVAKSDLMTVTDKLLAYMGGRDGDLDIKTTVAGQWREFFNQREKDHMADVKHLFALVFWARNIALMVFCFSLALLYIQYRLGQNAVVLSHNAPEELRLLARAHQVTFTAFIVISGVLIFIISRNFDHAFTVFHQLFFRNKLWILDPSTDLLINIVPIEFFTDISAFIGAVLLIVSLVAAGCASVYLYWHRPVQYRFR